MSGFWLRSAFLTLEGEVICLIPRRMNTRRNRRRVWASYWNREFQFDLTPDDDMREVRDECTLRTAAHCQDYLEQGGNLKAYSAWSGMRLRKLSKLVHDYNRGQLPGQNFIAFAAQGGAR